MARIAGIAGIGLLLAAMAACGDNVAAGPDASPDAAEPVGQGSEPTADIIITEVSPKGEPADWVELRNRSAEPIDLCDFFLTDSVDRLDHYLPLAAVAPPDPCEPMMLGGGEFLVIIADDDAGAGIDHAPFKLGEADEVHLVDTSGRAVDSLVYLYRDSSATLARIPTDSGLFFLADPTPGAENGEGR